MYPEHVKFIGRVRGRAILPRSHLTQIGLLFSRLFGALRTEAREDKERQGSAYFRPGSWLNEIKTNAE